MEQPSRKLSHFADDDDVQDDEPDGCAECVSPNYAYEDPSELHDELPEKPLCRNCILERAKP